MDNIRFEVQEIIKQISGKKNLDLNDSDDLFKLGYFDSLTVVQFIVALEKKFQIKISKSDINYTTFTHVTSIEHLIREKLK